MCNVLLEDTFRCSAILAPKLCCFDKCPDWQMLVSQGLKLIENKLIDIEGSCQLDANRRLNYDKIPSHLTECPGLKSGHLVIF